MHFGESCPVLDGTGEDGTNHPAVVHHPMSIDSHREESERGGMYFVKNEPQSSGCAARAVVDFGRFVSNE